jgi:membrane protease YdiL (CAAX protease family)
MRHNLGVTTDSRREGLRAFTRSVMPQDPSQLLFLAGIVCLVFAPRMSWWPAQLNASLSRMGIPDQQVRLNSAPFLVPGVWSIIFSGLAGYYVCFWPGRRAIRRLFYAVLLPTVAAICVIFGRFAYIGRPYSSILDKSMFGNPIHSAQWTGWTSTPGFHLTSVGLILIAIFISRMIIGISSLPLTLPNVKVADANDSQFRQKIQFLIWVLLGPLFLSAALVGVTIAAISLYFSSDRSAVVLSPLYVGLSTLLETGVYLLIVCWIVGNVGRDLLRRSVRLFQPMYFVIALAFPIGIAILISAGQYLVDRFQWAAHYFGETAIPQAGSYFNFPDPWLFYMFFAAFFEEVVFRGLLQSIFILRYGTYRAIFLTGIVWSAYHFGFDATSHPTETGVLSKLGFRIGICLALGSVLSWLTLRSGSVLPAAVTHTLYNVLVSSFGFDFFGKNFAWVGLWALLSWFLYQYWPVQVASQPEAEGAGPETVPAV